MNKDNYKKIADKYIVKEDKIGNLFKSFIGGGLIGLLGEGIIEILIKYCSLSRDLSSSIMILIMIFIASFLTGIGHFDDLAKIFKCGLLIPITGFSNSITSATIDYKKEGLVQGFGSNMFKLAGSVLLYGIVSAIIMAFIRYIGGF